MPTLLTASDGDVNKAGGMGGLGSKSPTVAVPDVDLTVKTVATTPYTDQKPGTSGVRKKTKVFMQPNYLENFVQATLDAVPASVPKDTLLIASDGRFWSDVAIQKVLGVALANGVKQVWVGKKGLCSTPAVSAVIRTGELPCFGAFILTASHNPGGLEEDFGIKYNGATGGPDESVYQVMYKNSLEIKEYKTVEGLGATLGGASAAAWDNVCEYTFADRRIRVIDTAAIHCELLKGIFDFPLIKKLVQHPKFSACFDCMCGVQGPYAQKILIDELGIKPESVLRGTPLPDFGGHDAPHHGHADPNLTHAHDLVNKMGLDTEGKPLQDGKTGPEDYPFFGAAWDGDADRNMILGRQFFVIPSDSLAFLVDQADQCIPYFKKAPIKSAARSMPTSRAVDAVCAKKGINMFETPTGWKFFGNLMESGDCAAFKDKPLYKPLICGEEAFGTASCHAREKDGMWAVLCYLQILAVKNESKLDSPDLTLTSVEDIAIAHWLEYGRHFYARYDWEEIATEKAKAFFADLESRLPTLVGTSMGEPFAAKITNADNFNYTDPVDGTKATNQGLRIYFEDGSRIVFRLSGTGVVGATIRVYLEKYLKSSKVDELVKNHLEEVKELGLAMVKWSKIASFTGREEPTLRT